MIFDKVAQLISAQDVYQIVTEECGATVNNYNQGFPEAWLEYACGDWNIFEWRFCGKLGFGGKIKADWRRIYVTHYQEDGTPERLRMIEAANKRLDKLVAQTMEQPSPA